MPVLDASAAVEVLLRTPVGLRGVWRLFEDELHAPHLLDIEFTQSLRRLILAHKLSGARADLALNMFVDLTITRHAHTAMLRRIWQLRSSISAYDAAYVALAEALDMPLLTCDARLSRSHGHCADIQLLV
jgi:predicted nucleic acid-binding protein